MKERMGVSAACLESELIPVGFHVHVGVLYLC